MSVAETSPTRSPLRTLASNLPLFRERLPRRPYCTDQLGAGLRIRGVAAAAASRYIQPNPPHALACLAFDVDRERAGHDWSDVDRNAPAPNLVVENPASGHAHLLYLLEVPVRTAPDGRLAPLRFAAGAQRCVRERLSADAGFCGLVVQNPLAEGAWTVWEPRTTLWSLDELAAWTLFDRKGEPVRQRQRERQADYGLGRNVELFERLRTWAYPEMRRGWPDAEEWYRVVLARAEALNTAPVPLPVNEVRATARSVARWTLRHLSSAGFSRAQAARGRKKGAGRRELLLPRARELAVQGVSVREIGRQLGVGRSTVSEWLHRQP